MVSVSDPLFPTLPGNICRGSALNTALGQPLASYNHTVPVSTMVIKLHNNDRDAYRNQLPRIRSRCSCLSDPRFTPYGRVSIISENPECRTLLEHGTECRAQSNDPSGSNHLFLKGHLWSQLEEVCKTYEAELGIGRRESIPFLLECLKSLLLLCSGPGFGGESPGNDRLAGATADYLRWFCIYFALACVDRFPGRFAVVCRWLYVHSIVVFLESQSDTYVNARPCDAAVIRLNVNVEATRVVAYAAPDDERLGRIERPDHLAALYFVPKLLKPKDKPLSWRFINGGLLDPLTPLSYVLTTLHKLIQNGTGVHWNQLVRTAVGSNLPMCLIMTGCDEVFSYVGWNNTPISRGDIDIRRLTLATNEVANMYTNLPQRETVGRLSGLPKCAYARSAKYIERTGSTSIHRTSPTAKRRAQSGRRRKIPHVLCLGPTRVGSCLARVPHPQRRLRGWWCHVSPARGPSDERELRCPRRKSHLILLRNLFPLGQDQ